MERRITRRTLKRLVTQAAAYTPNLTDTQLRKISATVEATDHVLVERFGNREEGCLVGQTYGSFEKVPKGARQFGYSFDALLRHHLRLPGGFSESRVALRWVSPNPDADEQRVKVTA